MSDEQVSEVPFGEITQTIQAVMRGASAAAVYGEPVQSGERLVVPAADLTGGFGFGIGAGRGPRTAGDDTGRGSGGGGGGGIRARPVAAIEIGPEGVQIQPIIDLTRVSLAGMVTGVFVLCWIVRLVRGAAAAKDGDPAKLAKAIRQVEA